MGITDDVHWAASLAEEGHTNASAADINRDPFGEYPLKSALAFRSRPPRTGIDSRFRRYVESRRLADLVSATDNRLPAGHRVVRTSALGGLHHEYHLVKDAS